MALFQSTGSLQNDVLKKVVGMQKWTGIKRVAHMYALLQGSGILESVGAEICRRRNEKGIILKRGVTYGAAREGKNG